MIFDFFGFGRRSRARLERIKRESKAREQWYHDGPWWKHPRWGGLWNDLD